RGHPLALVLGLEEVCERLRLLVERLRERALQRPVRRLLRRRKRKRAPRGEAAGQLERATEQLLRREDGADEPAAERLLRVGHPSGEDELLGEREPANAREPLRPAPAGND